MMMVQTEAPWEGWMSLHEAVKRYEVGYQTIRSWCTRGWLDRRLYKTRAFVPEVDLRELLQRQRGYIDPPQGPAGDED